MDSVEVVETDVVELVDSVEVVDSVVVELVGISTTIAPLITERYCEMSVPSVV